MNDKNIDPLWLLLILGPIGSLAGCAALLRSNHSLDKRAFFSAILNSGMLSIGIGAGVFWWYGTDTLWLPITLSILAGLGGNDIINFLLALLVKYVEGKVNQEIDDE